MPAARASATPPASARLLTTCVTAPAIWPLRACAISAARFEPRPEIRTVMRESAINKGRRNAGACSSNDDGVWAARRAFDNRADHLRTFAGVVEKGDRALGVARRDHDHHADAAIEYAMHFGVRDVAFALQPIEDRRPRPSLTLEPRLKLGRQNARHVFDETAAGDMRHAFDGNVADQLQQRARINPGRLEQLVTKRSTFKRHLEMNVRRFDDPPDQRKTV